MRRVLMMVLGMTLLSMFCGSAALAQLPENHYKVYEVPETYVFPGPVFLTDQFTQNEFVDLTLDKFATPVSKNGEPFFDEFRHQTWWKIDEVVEGRIVELFNQFGGARWTVRDAQYLVLPALKNDPSGPLAGNHYKCYDAVGPPIGFEVDLVDQFGATRLLVAEPVLFCNPVAKEVAGLVYPIEDPLVHLAVYRLDLGQIWDIPATAFDQFGDWQLTVEQEIWLAVPSEKLSVIGIESNSWGQIKSLYEN